MRIINAEDMIEEIKRLGGKILGASNFFPMQGSQS